MYSAHAFSKNGPLGTPWLAAHLERKLRRHQVNEASITITVDAILLPELAFSLRISAYLLLGVARIYSRKVDYLLSDCNGALSRMKECFPLVPPSNNVQVTTVDTVDHDIDMDDFEALPEKSWCYTGVDQHVSLAEHITLQEHTEDHDYFTSAFELDERFPDGSTMHVTTEFEEPQAITVTVTCSTPRNDGCTSSEIHWDDAFLEPRTPPSTSCSRFCIPDEPHHRLKRSLFDKLTPYTEEFELEEPQKNSQEPEVSEKNPKEPEKNPQEPEKHMETLPSENAITPRKHANEVVNFHTTELRSKRKRLAIPGDDVPSTHDSPRTPGREYQTTPRRRKRLVFDAAPVLSNDELREQLLEGESLVRPRKRLAFTSNDTSMLFRPSVTGICEKLQHIYTRRPITNTAEATPTVSESGRNGDFQELFIHQEPALPVSQEPEPKTTSDKKKIDDPESISDQAQAHDPEPKSLDRTETETNSVLGPETGFDPSEEADGSMLDSTGWSSRTRALGRFLRDVLRKESTITLEQVIGKASRKEAALGFFEILVLTTKDYIHVKQEAPFHAICITGRKKLMDDDFVDVSA